jgi:thiol-disulfide isomerase/thioredoxin
MTDIYESARCNNYSTERKSNMKTHLNRYRKCKKSHEAIKFNDEEIYELSLIKVEQRPYIQNKCDYCKKIFPTQELLQKHINKKCEQNNIINNTQNNNNVEITHNNEINNNIEINNGNINNITINNLNLQLPNGFEKEWITEHIDNYLKELLVLSETKYTSLLSKILENKKNLNVVLDKELDNGYVYIDDNYKNIVSLSMQKLNKELIKMADEVVNKKSYTKRFIPEEKKIIDEKFNKYIKDENTKKIVEECISDIYDSTKIDANEYFDEFKKFNVGY